MAVVKIIFSIILSCAFAQVLENEALTNNLDYYDEEEFQGRDYFPGVHQSINTSSITFNYNSIDQYGPPQWGQVWEECGWDHQSPINIDDSFTTPGKAPKLVMNYLDRSVVGVNVTNTGQTINYNLIFGSSRKNQLLWNGGNKIYNFDSIHLHWGLLCGGGSEHLINGHRFAAEIHLVHWNQVYGNFTNAALQDDGLAVVAVLLELAEEETNDGSNDNKFVKFLSKANNEGESILVTNPAGVFTVRELIKNEVNQYYSYKGSLTTPPCYETVRFIVSKKTVKIYPSELAILLGVRGRNGQILSNFRPIQHLNDRKIYDYNY